MDDLQRLRVRAGLSEDFDTTFDAGTTAAPRNLQFGGRMQEMMARLSGIAGGNRFADAMLEAGKVAGNMSGQEMWLRIVEALFQTRGR